MALRLKIMSVRCDKSFLYMYLSQPIHLYLLLSGNMVTNGGLFHLVDLLAA